MNFAYIDILEAIGTVESNYNWSQGIYVGIANGNCFINGIKIVGVPVDPQAGMVVNDCEV